MFYYIYFIILYSKVKKLESKEIGVQHVLSIMRTPSMIWYFGLFFVIVNFLLYVVTFSLIAIFALYTNVFFMLVFAIMIGTKINRSDEIFYLFVIFNVITYPLLFPIPLEPVGGFTEPYISSTWFVIYFYFLLESFLKKVLKTPKIVIIYIIIVIFCSLLPIIDGKYSDYINEKNAYLYKEQILGIDCNTTMGEVYYYYEGNEFAFKRKDFNSDNLWIFIPYSIKEEYYEENKPEYLEDFTNIEIEELYIKSGFEKFIDVLPTQEEINNVDALNKSACIRMKEDIVNLEPNIGDEIGKYKYMVFYNYEDEIFRLNLGLIDDAVADSELITEIYFRPKAEEISFEQD